MKKKYSMLIMFFAVTMFVYSSVPSGSNGTKETVVTEKSYENNETETKDGDKISEGKEELRADNNVKDRFSLVTIDTEENRSINLEFNQEIGGNKSDIDSYIKLDKNIPYNVVQYKNKIVINSTAFNRNDTYTVNINKNLTSKNGDKLSKDISKQVKFSNEEARIVFSNYGVFLPSTNNKLISFKTMNVKKVKVNVSKVYPNNLISFFNKIDMHGVNNSKELDVYTFYELGDIVYDKVFEIETSKNVWIDNEVDLSKHIEKGGVYLLDLEVYDSYKNNNNEDYYYYSRTHSKLIVVSDMSLIAHKSKDKLLVSALDIKDNSYLGNVKVSLYSINNQLLDEAVTDSRGQVEFKNNDKAVHILAEGNGERAILKLSGRELSFDDYQVSGVSIEEGIRTYVYTERPVYRPGDEINLSIIARNNGETFKDEHPITISCYSPTGKVYLKNTLIQDGKNGFYTYKFKTENNYETGNWRFVVNIGNYSTRKTVPIETVVASKIKTDIKMPKELNLKEKTKIDIELDSKYLFGSPAKNLKYNIKLKVIDDFPKFSRFSTYSFSNATSFSVNKEYEQTGELNEEGKAVVSFSLEELKQINNQLAAFATIEITDDDGRNSNYMRMVRIGKSEFQIGIENLKERYQEKANVKVICITNDAKNYITDKKLKYKIYHNTETWWYDTYETYQDYINSIKVSKKTRLIKEGDFVTEDKPSLLEVPIPSTNGLIIVEVYDEKTGKISSSRFDLSFYGINKNNLVENLKISTDKESYEVSDKAKIIFEGVKDSKALITVENKGEIITSYWKEVSDNQVEEEVTITKEMMPNAYVNVLLVQRYEKGNDRSLRLYGAVPLNVKSDENKLDIEIISPDQVKPNEKLKVKVKNQNKNKMDFTIALVDEGLLELAPYNVNPYAYFYAKLAMNTKVFDNYSNIIQADLIKAKNVLRTGGGDDGDEADMLKSAFDSKRDDNMGLEEAERFKALSIFKGVLTTDENGEAEVEFDIPNYMGRVRIIVVGVDGNKYGNSQKEVFVKDALVTRISAPRSLKVGDEFDISVNLYALEDSLGEVKIRTDFNGITQERTENFTSNNETKKVQIREKAPNIIGISKIKVDVSSNRNNYSEEIEIDVNTNAPYTYMELEKVIDAKSSTNFDYMPEAVKGSVKSSIVVSNKKLLGIDKRVKQLIRYPYGCAEQITSIAMSQLYIEDLIVLEEAEKEKIVANINKTIMKIRDYQLYDGSISYWPGTYYYSPYITAYVTEFLIRARDKGYYVADDVYDKLINFNKLMAKDAKELKLKVYYLYNLALSGNPNMSEMNAVQEHNFNTLYLIDQWRLLAAYAIIGEKEFAREKAALLLGNIKDETEQYYAYYSTSTSIRAGILNYYTEIFGKKDKHLYETILDRLKTNSWMSTMTASKSLIALVDKKEVNQKEVSAKITVGPIVDDIVTKNGIYIKEIKEDNQKINIENTSNSKIYVYLKWEGKPINYMGEDEAKVIQVKRYFFNTKGELIDVSKLTSGTTFWMALDVSYLKKSNYSYENLALVQMLPSGWEINNTRFLKDAVKVPSFNTAKITEDDYEDIRDDRVMWFFSINPEKSPVRHYIKINAVTPGKYVLPGTLVEEMYESDRIRSTIKGTVVEVN